MKPIIGPIARLTYSRKALIATADAMFSIASILITAYLAPDHVTTALAVIAALQPMIMTWIKAIATEDSTNTI